MEEVKFKVRMDKESEPKDVTLNVNFDDVPEELIYKHAMANMVVSWQGQIRNHWDEFAEGKLPEEVKFGDPLFASSRGRTIVKKVTVESAAEFLKEKSELERLDTLISMMEKSGMDVPEEVYEKHAALLDEAKD